MKVLLLLSVIMLIGCESIVSNGSNVIVKDDSVFNDTISCDSVWSNNIISTKTVSITQYDYEFRGVNLSDDVAVISSYDTYKIVDYDGFLDTLSGESKIDTVYHYNVYRYTRMFYEDGRYYATLTFDEFSEF